MKNLHNYLAENLQIKTGNEFIVLVNEGKEVIRVVDRYSRYIESTEGLNLSLHCLLALSHRELTLHEVLQTPMDLTDNYIFDNLLKNEIDRVNNKEDIIEFLVDILEDFDLMREFIISLKILPEYIAGVDFNSFLWNKKMTDIIEFDSLIYLVEAPEFANQKMREIQRELNKEFNEYCLNYIDRNELSQYLIYECKNDLDSLLNFIFSQRIEKINIDMLHFDKKIKEAEAEFFSDNGIYTPDLYIKKFGNYIIYKNPQSTEVYKKVLVEFYNGDKKIYEDYISIPLTLPLGALVGCRYEAFFENTKHIKHRASEVYITAEQWSKIRKEAQNLLRNHFGISVVDNVGIKLVSTYNLDYYYNEGLNAPTIDFSLYPLTCDTGIHFFKTKREAEECK